MCVHSGEIFIISMKVRTSEIGVINPRRNAVKATWLPDLLPM